MWAWHVYCAVRIEQEDIRSLGFWDESMSWSDRLQELRNGSLHLATVAEGQLGKLLRKSSAPPAPSPANHQRFEPRNLADPDLREPASRSEHDRSPYSPTPLDELPARPAPNQSATRRCEAPLRSLRLASAAARITPVPPFQVGERIGAELQVERILRRSSFFDSYVARHLAWGVDLVVKVPQKHLLANADSLQSIADAASRWTALGLHPHIVYCYALEIIDGVPLLLLEHARGGDLRTRLDRGFTTDLRRGLNFGIQLCHALEHAHDDGFWHGALTPENLFFADDESLLVTDLGIAAHCRTYCSAAETGSDPRGIQRYLAPDLSSDPQAIDARADIFSLGVCLHETLCGKVPDGSTHDTLDPPAPRLRGGGLAPRRLAQLLGACLAWDPTQRPARVADVRQELCAIYEDEFQQPSPYAQLRPAAWRADGWNNQALVACWLGKKEEADMAWSNALHGAPGHVDSTFNRALMRWRWGEISDGDALSELERLVDPHTRHEDVAHLLGFVHLERGDPSSALLSFERAARHKTEDEGVLQALEQARAEVAAGDGRHELNGHEDFVSAVAFHPGKRWVVSAGDDCRLIVWDVRESRPVRTLTGHLERLSAVSLNGDGSIVVSGSDDATLKVWNTTTGACLKNLATVGPVFSVALSADGRRAVSSSSGTNNFLGIDNTVLQVWDVDRERCLGELIGHTSAAKALALTADGQTAFSAADDHTVRVWDLGRFRCRRVLEGHRHYVTSVCATPDGKKALSGSWDQTIRVWDARSGECIRVLTGPTTIVTCVAVSSDGRTAISGCWDGSVRLWDVETGRCLRTFAGHSRMVTGVALSTDGRTAVSGSWDGTVLVWNLPERPIASPLRLSQRH
jgi:WD40 repeat protein/serine/threonine protein kinase